MLIYLKGSKRTGWTIHSSNQTEGRLETLWVNWLAVNLFTLTFTFRFHTFYILSLSPLLADEVNASWPQDSPSLLFRTHKRTGSNTLLQNTWKKEEEEEKEETSSAPVAAEERQKNKFHRPRSRFAPLVTCWTSDTGTQESRSSNSTSTCTSLIDTLHPSWERMKRKK